MKLIHILATSSFASNFRKMIGSLDFLRDIDTIPQSVFVLHETIPYIFPEHSHLKGQFIYIEGGVAYIHMVDKTLVIPSRHYVWIPKNYAHSVEMHKSVIIRTIYFHDEDEHPFFSKCGIYPLNMMLMQMLAYTEKWSGHILPGETGYLFLMGIKEILPEISRNALPIAVPVTSNQRIAPAIAYINEHLFDNSLTIQLVCRATGFSERTLSRLFQNTLQISFLQYLRLLKMIKAMEMMLQTECSMSEIAYTLGYNSLSAFSNVFYQITKTRPSEFVKQLSI